MPKEPIKPISDDIPFGGPDEKSLEAKTDSAIEAKIEHGGVALVNQSDADQEIIASIRRELVDLRKELEHEQQVNRELDELSVERLNQINQLTQEKIAGGTFAQQCFLAIIQGLAAHGDLSMNTPGAPSRGPQSDTHTATLAKHAAGIAGFMAQAAKTNRL